MDETMPRPPSATAGRIEAPPSLAPVAPANVAAPPAPRAEAAKATPPAEDNASAKAAADGGDVLRRQRGAAKPAAVADAKTAEPAVTADKRKVDAFAKERALAPEAKQEAPAPFPAVPSQREAQATGSLGAAANEVAKKTDESRRSRATDAVEQAAAPPAAPSVAQAPAPLPRPAAPAVAAAPAAPPAATGSTTTSPAEAAPAPFSGLAQRQRALSDALAKDADGGAAAAQQATAPSRNEAERARLDKAQPAGSVAATPLAPVLAAIAADPARWSRRTAAGPTVALDAGWRAWLSELDAAAAGRWRALDGGAFASSETDPGRDAAAGRASATTLRLFSDGRLAAVVRVDAATVQLDAAPGTGGERWQAALSPVDAERLRTTSRRLAP